MRSFSVFSVFVVLAMVGGWTTLVQAQKPDPPPQTAEVDDIGTSDPDPDADAEVDVVALEGELFAERDVEAETETADETAQPLVIIEQAPAPTVIVHTQAAEAERPGTHMVLELSAGAALGDEPGEAGGALFGVGGKPVGFPWRFYFITEIGQTHMRDAGMLSTGMFAADRRYWDIAAGLRIYIPVWGPVRVFGDATLGGAFVSSSLIRPDLAPLEAEDWFVMGAVAAGVQLRILHELSIGARAKVLVADDGLSELRDRLDIPPGIPATLTAGVTWHI